MDLGISGRKAIVCASSRGLGRGCALALAQAGCEVIVNGRDSKALEATVAELRKSTGAKVSAVLADVATPAGQAALLSACPEPDILVNNNAGPPFRDFRELTRAQMIDGVIANMVVAIELTQKVIDSMCAKKFGRIVNITSGSVKMPLSGLDLSSGRRRALGCRLQRNHQLSPPRRFRYRATRLEHGDHCEEAGHLDRGGKNRADGKRAGQAIRHGGRVRRGLRLFVLGAGRLYHRAEPAHRWWGLSWSAVTTR